MSHLNVSIGDHICEANGTPFMDEPDKKKRALIFRCYKMYFSLTNRIGLKGGAYRNYFRTFSIFLGRWN